MRKKLITHRNLNEYLANTGNEFIVDNTMILSPSVLDYLKEKGIKIVYKANINSKLDNNLEKEIKEFLHREYNFKNQVEISEITNRVIKIIESEG